MCLSYPNFSGVYGLGTTSPPKIPISAFGAVVWLLLAIYAELFARRCHYTDLFLHAWAQHDVFFVAYCSTLIERSSSPSSSLYCSESPDTLQPIQFLLLPHYKAKVSLNTKPSVSGRIKVHVVQICTYGASPNHLLAIVASDRPWATLLTCAHWQNLKVDWIYSTKRMMTQSYGWKPQRLRHSQNEKPSTHQCYVSN